MLSNPNDFDTLAVSTVRGLSLDGPHAASSGHQGTAMALAPAAHVLYSRVMRYDASDPYWPDRDRLILSAGHASMLLYSMLYLTGHGLELDDLRQFRQWGSATPGHPEAGHTAGVEVTTGPLGQGLGNAVGMAMAEAHLRATFGPDICDHAVWAIAGDGCMSEGISHEAGSLAGHLRLGRLNVIYDDNKVTIDGPTSLAFSDDTAARFAAYGWHVIDAGAIGDDLDALEAAFVEARANEDQPSLVIVSTDIGAPSPKWTGRYEAHGKPFDAQEIAATKAMMGLPDEPFFVPDSVLDQYRELGCRYSDDRTEWSVRLDSLSPADRLRWDTQQSQQGYDEFEDALPSFPIDKSVATRVASQRCLAAIDPVVPGLMVGSADLKGSNGVDLEAATFAPGSYDGRQIHYGVREHAMGAAAVGMALHSGVVPVVATFLVFSDYMRPAVRLAALSNAKVIFVWSHDSIGVGEDGPTHQPVEQLMSLRAIPNLLVIRPADATETAGAWQTAIDHDGPSAIITTRQGVPTLAGTQAESVVDGAYAVVDCDDPDVVLLSSGSEVHLCVEAADRLAEDGFEVRVVSMPAWKLFDDDRDTEGLLPSEAPIVSVEAGVTAGWAKWSDVSLGIDRFGSSAPASELFEHYGLTVDAVVDAATEVIETLAE